MNERLYYGLLGAIALGFTAFFCITIVPPLLADPDVFGALAAGFVNPYASGYATDVILCWLALAVWVIHERLAYGIRHGWVCLLLGMAPGVAVGMAVYLIIRQRQRAAAPGMV